LNDTSYAVNIDYRIDNDRTHQLRRYTIVLTAPDHFTAYEWAEEALDAELNYEDYTIVEIDHE